jgi:thiol-disulfide isomerase/thioredoxin
MPARSRLARRAAAFALALPLALACKQEDTVVVSPAARPPPSAAPAPARPSLTGPAEVLAAIDIFRPTSAAAPKIDLPTLEGARFSLEKAKGQVVFVNFWATWCPPCRDEMPSMLALGKELQARYPGKFKMVAVSADDGWAPVREFFKAPPYGGSTQNVTVALDLEKKTVEGYYCTARGTCPQILFPESYIVGKDGKLVGFFEGPLDWSRPEVRSYLEKLIGS